MARTTFLKSSRTSSESTVQGTTTSATMMAPRHQKQRISLPSDSQDSFQASPATGQPLWPVRATSWTMVCRRPPMQTPTSHIKGPRHYGIITTTVCHHRRRILPSRKLRRVASAPNAQGLFGAAKSDRPATAELGKEPLVQHENSSTLGLVEQPKGDLLPVPTGKPVTSAGQLRQSIAFRRTYSSNSIKVRDVEVEPGSFDKIKLIGKGDVGKVYLVREKKSSRLYAMKGKLDEDLGGCSDADMLQF